MATVIPKAIHEQIQCHAVACYPEECCGLLIGQDDGQCKRIQAIRKVQNAAEESRQNRYLIAPLDLLNAENFARSHGWEILGIYHSHPDHLPHPSRRDREHAILYYSYIILCVSKDRAGELSCWVLHDWDSSFTPEKVQVCE